MSQRFINSFRAIGFQCNQLNSFILIVTTGIYGYKLKYKPIYDSLNLFNNLNHLDLRLSRPDEQNNQISCESLKELKLLMSLKIYLRRTCHIFLENIDKHLPQLKHLNIIVENDRIIFIDKALNSLSKLSKLQTLRIDSNQDLIFIAEEKLLNVINNCPQINSIRFEKRTNISHRTIDALIALALRKPRVKYNHCFCDIEKEPHFRRKRNRKKRVIHLQTYQFPNNLNIDSRSSGVEDNHFWG
jgi:hypothetical protein